MRAEGCIAGTSPRKAELLVTSGESVEASLNSPETVHEHFQELFASQGGQAAAAYLWELERSLGYLNPPATQSLWYWQKPVGGIRLEISVNQRKPEKDPRTIAAAAQTDAGSASRKDGTLTSHGSDREPQCDLCWENEGWSGSERHPAKPGLRIGPLELQGERWGFQYSPYGYFDEHCIVLTAEHRPMAVGEATVPTLLELVDDFPAYFFGSNADLPIVGGSILSHEHYQGGRHQFPMMEANVRGTVPLKDHPDVQVEVLEWPAAALRLRSSSAEALSSAAQTLVHRWEDFEDPACAIQSYSIDGQGHRLRHNAWNPIVRKTAEGYELYLVLRNNRTTPDRPFGLFHPAEQYFFLKKENIGLIEIMGLAILPGRLAQELPALQELLYQSALEQLSVAQMKEQLMAYPRLRSFEWWAREVYERRFSALREEAQARPELVGEEPSTKARQWDGLGDIPMGKGADKAAQEPSQESVCPLGPVLKEEVATIFGAILADTNVFRMDEQGWERFLAPLVA